METNTLNTFPNLEKVLQEYGEALKQKYKREISDKGHDASSTLNQSVQWVIEHQDKSYLISLRLADYWKWLENGRGPGKFPPPNKIQEWIEVKPVVPYPMKNGKLPTTAQLTYLISRKIAREGTPPTKLLDKSIEEINAEYLPKIKQAFLQDGGKMFKAIFTDIFHNSEV